MPYLLSIVGKSYPAKLDVMEKLTAALVRRNLKVGAAIHRLVGADGGAGDGEAKRLAAAGAGQVLVTRGTEAVLRGKHGGITALKRAAARYFNAADILLAIGYLDPVDKLEVCSPGGTVRFDSSPDAGLLAVVGDGISPTPPIPSFRPNEVEDLAALIIAAREKKRCPAA